MKTADEDHSDSIKGKACVEGIITSRKCDCCGHHEIGMTTPDGVYIPLKPGMWIKIEVSV